MADSQKILSAEFLKLLECPVCLQYMAAPIEQCMRGHSICKGCKENISICPLCQAEFNGSRNYLAESMAEKLLEPCVNAGAGCTTRLLKAELKTHEQSCPHRVYHCFAGMASDCKWTGRSAELLDHVKHEHMEFVLSGLPMRLRWNNASFQEARYRCFLLAFDEEIFWYYFIVNPDKKTAFFWVQFIGPVDKAANFRYRLEYKSSDKKRDLTFTDLTYSDLHDIDSILESRKCLELSHGVAEYFTDKRNSILSTLSILKIKSE